MSRKGSSCGGTTAILKPILRAVIERSSCTVGAKDRSTFYKLVEISESSGVHCTQSKKKVFKYKTIICICVTLFCC